MSAEIPEEDCSQRLIVHQKVKVDHDIPIPDRVIYKWPWNEMKSVGDSFLCKLNSVDEEVVLANMRSQASNMGKKLGLKFRALRSKGGVRVWRVE